MSIQARRRRERAERERLIVTAARDLLESEGWDAVTTRRLADRIEYSQPVLYSHFKGKSAIMAAVATAGFADLAVELRAARVAAGEPRQALAAVAAAYAGFAERHPTLYEAMFTQPVDLPFGRPDTPPALRQAYEELREGLRPFTREDNVETLTETFWSALHGLLVLRRSGRLPRDDHERRLALLLDRFAT
ncbi:TetR/AcrR family transcriptional regulator [Nonomuraea terrae]|uniref:TetR/AcrR family transcriptional regulator n=1 Tax=Nonomuraea terrae TaxID=2530383 RepID=UPI0037B4A7A0